MNIQKFKICFSAQSQERLEQIFHAASFSRGGAQVIFFQFSAFLEFVAAVTSNSIIKVRNQFVVGMLQSSDNVTILHDMA